ncbi:Succinate-semialdehyde dehydrogenase mitochondrial [Zea mays]|uniref:Succinate-semialdehyde dehydrogenase mitochondrial n=1 Tax=Zea mays TaxID=4577 RepID=A0A1D6QS73_MAIZE|nr:Succinate-semialdehyde dehydrogenase mitochondrial [Zea mays]
MYILFIIFHHHFTLNPKERGWWGIYCNHDILLKRAQMELGQERSRKLAPLIHEMLSPMVRALTRALSPDPLPAPYTRVHPP